jgi:hypothetical protein
LGKRRLIEISRIQDRRMPLTEEDLPLQNYDRQRAGSIAAKLTGFTQHELRVIREYESNRENRAIVLERIAELSGQEPWAGYDEQSLEEITAALADADAATVRQVLRYEREHKSRAAIIRAANPAR